MTQVSTPDVRKRLSREQDAVAMLLCGASYAEVMEATGLTLAEAQLAWNRRSNRTAGDDRAADNA